LDRTYLHLLVLVSSLDIFRLCVLYQTDSAFLALSFSIYVKHLPYRIMTLNKIIHATLISQSLLCNISGCQHNIPSLCHSLSIMH